MYSIFERLQHSCDKRRSEEIGKALLKIDFPRFKHPAKVALVIILLRYTLNILNNKNKQMQL